MEEPSLAPSGRRQPSLSPAPFPRILWAPGSPVCTIQDRTDRSPAPRRCMSMLELTPHSIPPVSRSRGPAPLGAHSQQVKGKEGTQLIHEIIPSGWGGGSGTGGAQGSPKGTVDKQDSGPRPCYVLTPLPSTPALSPSAPLAQPPEGRTKSPLDSWGNFSFCVLGLLDVEQGCVCLPRVPTAI